MQEEHFGRKQQHDITGYNVLPRNFCTYRNRSDGVDFTFNVNECCDMGIISKFYPVFCGNDNDTFFLSLVLNNSDEVVHEIAFTCIGTGQKVLSFLDLQKMSIRVPKQSEQKKISTYFKQLDDLITLHQCEPKNKMEDNKMLDNINNQILFYDYYEKWIKVYKEGAIRKVTLEKYYMTHRWLKKLIPELKICEMARINYQQLLNDYALYHERQTTMDFHHQLKGAILDAVDEGLLDRDPTRKAIIKGKTPAAKKIKYINQFELHTLLNNLRSF